LVSASDSTGNGSYTYDTAGLLLNRLVGNRLTSITSRDGEGRPLSITTAVNTISQMTESLTWSGDGLLTADTLARADFTDSRNYSYASLSRRLTQEQINLNSAARWTNSLVYDNGVAGGLGALTQMGLASGTSNKWNGVADAFARISTETNNTFHFAAYGHVNGQSTLTAWLDNQPTPITGVGTNAMLWRGMMELNPGLHQLKVAASHPSGYYTAWATNSFTNNIAYQRTVDGYDGAGNVTSRIWKNPNGTTNRTQTLSWDARGRLYSVTERDASNSGYNWTAMYDGLSRRLSTTSILVTNGVALTSQPTTINSYYDPQMEFLELGVSYGLTTEWKLYGPDLNGRYGGLNGTGAFDAVSPYLNLFNPVISDFRGNILGVVTNGVVSWNPARPTGYGSVPGYRPVALASGVNLAQSSAWRGKWVDITGYYNVGLRPYNPISGGWLTYDSTWNERDPNSYTFAGGDPINYFDSDGRFGKGFYNATGDLISGTAGLVNNAYFSMSYGLAAMTYGTDQANQWYGQNLQGLENSVFGAAQLTYNVSAMATYGLISPFAPNLAYDSFGGNMQQLFGQAPAFYGGNNQSMAYQLGYGTVALGTMFMGGEAGVVGNFGKIEDIAGATRSATTLGETTYNVSFGSTGSRILDSLGLQSAKISDIAVTIDPTLIGADLANVTVHEGFHVAVAETFPNFAASSGRLPYFGAFPLYAEEVGAYGYGAFSAGQYGKLFIAPISAFGSMSAGQTISVLGTGAAVGGLWYFGNH